MNRKHLEISKRVKINCILLVVSCPCQNTGLVDALMENDVQASYSGHDHNNDFGGFYHKDGRKIDL